MGKNQLHYCGVLDKGADPGILTEGHCWALLELNWVPFFWNFIKKLMAITFIMLSLDSFILVSLLKLSILEELTFYFSTERPSRHEIKLFLWHHLRCTNDRSLIMKRDLIWRDILYNFECIWPHSETSFHLVLVKFKQSAKMGVCETLWLTKHSQNDASMIKSVHGTQWFNITYIFF